MLFVVSLPLLLGLNVGTYKTRRVVVANGLGITKRLKQWVGLENDVLDTQHLGIVTTDGCNVLHHTLGSLCFTSATFTTTRHDKTVVSDDPINQSINQSITGTHSM
jgi:hypothetical protein